MACISRFATAILSGETELALGTIRVKIAYNSTFRINNFNDTPDQVPASLLCHLSNRNSLELIIV